MPRRLRKVLIADGSQAAVMYLSILLNRMGCKVVPAEDGDEALRLARMARPDLMILGTGLQGLLEIDVLRSIRADGDLAALPVLVIGGRGGGRWERACLELGCLDHLVKPVPLAGINAALQRGFASSRGWERQYMRAFFNRRVSLSGKGEKTDDMALTLSERGVYLRRRKLLPVGTAVDIDLPFEGEGTVRVAGRVLYHNPVSPGVFRVDPGMAVEFPDLAPAEAAAMTEQVKKLLAGDIVAEQDEPVISLD